MVFYAVAAHVHAAVAADAAAKIFAGFVPRILTFWGVQIVAAVKINADADAVNAF